MELTSKSFFVGDATRLSQVIVSNSTMPVAYDCIIGNPPYVSQGKKSNLYISFVKNILEFSSIKSCSALVLPLSICYSQGTEFVELRKKYKLTMLLGSFIIMIEVRIPYLGTKLKQEILLFSVKQFKERGNCILQNFNVGHLNLGGDYLKKLVCAI